MMYCEIISSMVIPCVELAENCYGRVCCEPYICYEETACITVNTTINYSVL